MRWYLSGRRFKPDRPDHSILKFLQDVRGGIFPPVLKEILQIQVCFLNEKYTFDTFHQLLFHHKDPIHKSMLN